jgi:flagellar motility protein MotE (MotC chaperone)
MLKWLFGTSAKAYPILRADVLQPKDADISTAEAKRIYKAWMLQIGFYKNKDSIDRAELADAIEYFAMAIKETEQYLKDELDHEKQIIKDEADGIKKEITKWREDLKTASKEEKEEIRESIDYATLELKTLETTRLERATAEYASFKASKRDFLIDYINKETNGDDWQQVKP